MKFSLKSNDILSSTADTVVLLRYENNIKDETIKKVNTKLKDFLFDKIKSHKFDGQFGKILTLDSVYSYKFKNILIVGLGKKVKLNSMEAFRIGNIIAKNTKGSSKSVAIEYTNLPGESLGLILEGIILGAYEYNQFKTVNQNKNEIEELIFYSKKISSSFFNSKVNSAKIISSSICFSRDLVNDPPNILTPEILADHALSLAKNSDALDCKIYDEKDMAEMGMGALRAVSFGSDKPPRFIHLSYNPKNKTRKKIAIVGKGITFDSGGLCIKPADSMRTMKMDMAGAAAVLGVMKAIGEIKPNVSVHGLIPASENMTGGSAYKPDDVVKASNGKTIEIINTDAEGRLALSDALSYAVKNKMTEIIDLATLTGACIVGLGAYTAGVIGNNQKLINSVLDSAGRSGEKMWQLPLDEELKDEIKSNIADMKNSGSRWGGAITAALFLENFVSEIPWVHIDIAGPAYIEKPNDWYPYGATGFGVKTVLDYLTSK
ncbi:MAG: leucyl aminopeptidase [Thermodesulfobacteriota bacterium]